MRDSDKCPHVCTICPISYSPTYGHKIIPPRRDDRFRMRYLALTRVFIRRFILDPEKQTQSGTRAKRDISSTAITLRSGQTGYPVSSISLTSPLFRNSNLVVTSSVSFYNLYIFFYILYIIYFIYYIYIF